MSCTLKRFAALRTHKEISAIFAARGEKISRQRVHQIEQRALRKLRKALAEYDESNERRADDHD